MDGLVPQSGYPGCAISRTFGGTLGLFTHTRCGRRTGSVNGHQFAEAAGQAANTIQDIQSGAGANFELSIETGEVSRAIASCARRYGADLAHRLAGPQPQHEVQPQRNDLKNRPGRECF